MWKTHQKFKRQKQLEEKIHTHSENQMLFILFDISRTHWQLLHQNKPKTVNK